MTATRRISNPHKKYDSGESQITYSMENNELYGNISHSLSFKKAADLGVIAKFKIVLNFVTSSELKEELRRKSTTLLNGDEIRAEHFSRQLALSKAIKKYKIDKVFSFHRTVNRAKTFVSKEVMVLKFF